MSEAYSHAPHNESLSSAGTLKYAVNNTGMLYVNPPTSALKYLYLLKALCLLLCVYIYWGTSCSATSSREFSVVVGYELQIRSS